MPQWFNGPLQLFHGTNLRAAAVPAGAAPGMSVPFRPNLALCRPNTDFGQGFYTTTSLHQARQWANMSTLKAPPPGTKAVVLAFDIDRDVLAGLDTLAFVRPIADFWNLVTDCRLGFPPHGRYPPRPRPYDVVYGPVTIWPQRLVIGDCDQVSFHTQRAIRALGGPVLFDKAAADMFP